MASGVFWHGIALQFVAEIRRKANRSVSLGVAARPSTIARYKEIVQINSTKYKQKDIITSRTFHVPTWRPSS